MQLFYELKIARRGHAVCSCAGPADKGCETISKWQAGGMKSLREQLWFEVSGRRGFVNITDTITELVRKSGVQEGLCLVNAMQLYQLPPSGLVLHQRYARLY